MSKIRIIGVLGEEGLLLPEWVNAGLLANERVKYLFSLLQAACWHAERPDAPVPDLEANRRAAEMPDAWLDTVVKGARLAEFGYTIPNAERLVRRMLAEAKTMLRPIQAAVPEESSGALAHRLETLQTAFALHGNRMDGPLVDRIAAVDPKGEDSLHRLVMDLHKALNALQAEIAQTDIEGAATYGLAEDDVGLVRAFMQGVNETAPLKFGHPGLDTTATRRDAKLVLQNDIGTTDAHVLVVHVEGLTLTVTYTDIHLERLNFFRALSDGFDLSWRNIESRQNQALADNAMFYLATGTFAAAARPALEAYLRHLGANLVFLIDWNRARKRLRLLVSKSLAVDLLHWAAKNRYGHRAFLILGGDKLVFETLTFAAKAPLPYGARLDEMLGEESTVDYMKFLFRTATEGLLAGRSEALIRDQVRAELITRFNSAEGLVMGLIADHAAFILSVAELVRDLILLGMERDDAAAFDKAARSAKEWETRADHLVIRVRALVKRSGGPSVLRHLIEEADNAIDALEEAAFLLTLEPVRRVDRALFGLQKDLSTLLVEAAEAWGQAVANAPRVRRGGEREDLQSFLVAVDCIVGIERRCDLAERAAKAQSLVMAGDFRQLYVFNEFGAKLEGATDSLMRAAQVLSEHILSDVITA